jgi:Tfp pilus assembly protein PilO
MKAWHIIVIILCVLTLGVYTQPRMEKVQKLKTKYENLLTERKAMNIQVNKIQKTKEDKQKSQENFAKSIPPQNEQEKLIHDIQNLTTRSGFSFDDISFVKGHNPIVGMPEIKATFSTTGDKKRLIRFLTSIEQNPRFLGMDSLSISTRIEKTSPVVTFLVSLYAFYQKES